MTSSDDPANKEAGTCPVCAASMAADDDRCASCGATRGEQHKCPFCGVVARPEPHAVLRFACPACGAPRVPAVDGVTPSASMSKALSVARSARSSRSVWRLAAGLAGGFGALATLILVGVALVASPAMLPLLAAGVVTAMPFVFAVLALRNAANREQQLQQSLDEAWIQAAKELTAVRGSLGRQDLADAFGIDEDLSKDLLARLGAHNEVATDVTEDGELALSMRVPDRVRIAEHARVEAPTEQEGVQIEADTELDASDATREVSR